MRRRSKPESPTKRAGDRVTIRAHSQEDPRGGGEGQASRVPAQGAGGLGSPDWPQVRECASLDSGTSLPASVSDASISTVEPELSHYKGISLKNIGRDAKGRVIPHKRSDIVARQVAEWAAGGYDANAIAVRLNIRPGLLKECYAVELATGADQVGMEVTSHIIKRTQKSDRMAIFYAKAKMGWRDGEGKPLDTGVLMIHIHAD